MKLDINLSLSLSFFRFNTKSFILNLNEKKIQKSNKTFLLMLFKDLEKEIY